MGVEAVPEMVEEVLRLNPRARFEDAEAESLPFPDGNADMVLSRISFDHRADQAKGVREIARVLRPGRWFCPADHEFLLDRLRGDKVRTRGEVRELARAAGLTVRRQQGLGLQFVQITLAQR